MVLKQLKQPQRQDDKHFFKRARESLLRDLKNWNLSMLEEEDFEKALRERALFLKIRSEKEGSP